jgi:hypothetical protein
VKKKIVKGIELKDKNVKFNPLTTHSSQILKANEFLQSKVQDFPKTLLLHIIIFKRLFRGEKIKD